MWDYWHDYIINDQKYIITHIGYRTPCGRRTYKDERDKNTTIFTIKAWGTKGYR